ncbi:MAG: NDP-sugar synthase [Spirochaetes bacterium]|nr:NDP-sugar synthase [Spirochaetota bacterium]
MKAFLLAAGHGERLRPLTDIIPKPLAPVMNVPSICYALTLLKEAGVSEVVCNLHHLGDAIEAFFREHDCFGFDVVFSREEKILGTGGGLANCREYFQDAPFIYLNSDMIADIDLGAVGRAREASGSAGTLVLAPAGAGVGRVTVREERVVNLRSMLPDEARPGHDFLGAAVLSPGIFRYLKEGFSDIVEHGFIDLARDGALGYYLHDGAWHDIGSMESYRAANMALLGMPAACKRRVRDATGMDPVALAGGAVIGRDVVVEGSVIGDGCVIGDGARIARSVLLPGTSLRAGEEAERTVRWAYV